MQENHQNAMSQPKLEPVRMSQSGLRSVLGRLYCISYTVLYNGIMKNEFYIAFNHFLPWEYLIEIHL